MNIQQLYKCVFPMSGLFSSVVWARDKDQDVSNFTGVLALGIALYLVATRFLHSQEDRLVVGFWWLLTIAYMAHNAGGFEGNMLIGPFALASAYADRSYGLLILALAIFIQLIPMIISTRIGLEYVRSSSSDIGRFIAGVATLALVLFWFYIFYSLYPTASNSIGVQ